MEAENERYFLIGLYLRGLTFSRLQKILEDYSSLEEALINKFSKIKAWDKLEPNLISTLSIKSDALDFLKAHQDIQINILTCFDSNFNNYKALEGNLMLFYKGDLDLINSQSIAFVGSREYTSYSENVCKSFIENIGDKNVVIVSGLAEGIDGLSHKYALENDLKTIAVLGSSLDKTSVYPQSNYELSIDIINKGGLLLSLLPCNTSPKPYNFPIRNQLIVDISQKVLVVQAASNSGSLITGKLALKQNKCFVPFCPLFNSNYEGILQLHSNGAAVISNINQLITGQDLIYSENTKTLNGLFKADAKNILLKQVDYSRLSDIEETIVKTIEQGFGSLDSIIQKTSLDPSIVNQTLSMLELEDIIDFDQVNGWRVR